MGGVGTANYREGVHFRIPYVERPIIFDVRARPHTMSSLTGSRDLQMVNISVRVLFKPDPNKLPDLYRYLGLDFDERVLPSIINEVLKSVVAQQQAERARYLVLKATEEKKKTIIHVEGEKASAAMIGDAIKANPGFIELRRIQVAKEVAGLLSKSSNRMVLSTDSLLLNLMGSSNITENMDRADKANKK